jgi:hypothetical protein
MDTFSLLNISGLALYMKDRTGYKFKNTEGTHCYLHYIIYPVIQKPKVGEMVSHETNCMIEDLIFIS